MTRLRRAAAFALAGLTVGSWASAGGRDDPPTATDGTPEPASRPERLEAEGVENLFRLSPRLYSGAQPEGDAGFESLRKLGIRTIITVDGASPDVGRARRAGMRYVHLPIGYDGVPRDRALRLVRALRTLPGPVFVHCHHGQHRGPAAAAVCGIATEGWSREAALAWLEEAGTSPDYRGLFASVGAFAPPGPEELAGVEGDLPERAEVPDLVARMVEVDGLWDRLKASRAAGFRAPPSHPDVDPPHEALMLAEQFRESVRLAESEGRPGEFLGGLRTAAGRAEALADRLKAPGERAAAEAAFQAVSRSCTSCHARHRDRPTEPAAAQTVGDNAVR